MPEYRSTIRVYDLDDHGQPFALRYAVGDVIPDDEAERQGLTGTPAAGKKIPPPENKARRTTKPKEK